MPHPIIFTAALLLGLTVPSYGDESTNHQAPAWEVPAGRYASDERLPRLLRTMVQARRSALRDLKQSWGLELGSLPVRWVVDTSHPATPQATVATAGHASVTSFEFGRTLVDATEVTVVIPARKFLQQPARAAKVIRHEVVHAAFASSLGAARYETLANWFREGVAFFISGEGEERFRERMAYSVFLGRPAASFLDWSPGPEPVPPSFAYAAVKYLHAHLGEPGLKALLGEVVSGARLDSVLRRRGLGGERPVLRQARDHARQRVRRLLPAERQKAFQTARSKLRGDPAEAILAFEVQLSEDETGPLAGTLRYLLAKEALRAANADGRARAQGHLRRLLESSDALWRPEALVLLGQALIEQGRRPSAARRWLQEAQEAYAEDIPVAEQAQRLLRRLAKESESS